MSTSHRTALLGSIFVTLSIVAIGVGISSRETPASADHDWTCFDGSGQSIPRDQAWDRVTTGLTWGCFNSDGTDYVWPTGSAGGQCPYSAKLNGAVAVDYKCTMDRCNFPGGGYCMWPSGGVTGGTTGGTTTGGGGTTTGGGGTTGWTPTPSPAYCYHKSDDGQLVKCSTGGQMTCTYPNGEVCTMKTGGMTDWSKKCFDSTGKGIPEGEAWEMKNQGKLQWGCFREDGSDAWTAGTPGAMSSSNCPFSVKLDGKVVAGYKSTSYKSTYPDGTYCTWPDSHDCTLDSILVPEDQRYKNNHTIDWQCLDSSGNSTSGGGGGGGGTGGGSSTPTRPPEEMQCYRNYRTGDIWFGYSKEGATQDVKEYCYKRNIYPGDSKQTKCWKFIDLNSVSVSLYFGFEPPVSGAVVHMTEVDRDEYCLKRGMAPESWLNLGKEIGPGETQCKMGATKDDGCNTCVCTSEGEWVCTLRYCPEEEPVCGNDICEEGEGMDCPSCPPGATICPLAACRPGSCPEDCESDWEDPRTFEQYKKELEREMKQYTRSARDMRRQAKEMGSEKALILIDEYESNAMQALSCVTGAKSKNALRDCEQYRDTLNDLSMDIWPRLQEGNIQRDLKNLAREQKNMEGELKRIQRESDIDVSSLDAILQDFKDTIAEIKELASSDPQEVSYLLPEVWDLQRQFFEESQFLQQDLWRGQACRDAERGLREGERGMEEFVPQVIERVRGKKPDVAREMEEYLEKASELLDAARAALKGEDCEEALHRMDEFHVKTSDEFSQRFADDVDDLEEEFDIVDYDDVYEDFADEREFEKDVVEQFKKRNYRAVDIDFMRRIAGEVLEEYLGLHTDAEGPDVLQSARELKLAAAQVQELLQVKNDLLTAVASLREEVQTLKAGLRDIFAEVEQFVFGPKTAQDAEDFLEELPSLTEKEAQERLAELKEDAGEELYVADVIPYKDTPVGKWFTAPIKEAKDFGIVEGTGESDGEKVEPAREANVVEAIAMIARVIPGELDEDAEPRSDLGDAAPDWAKPYIAELEEAGVPVDDIFEGKDPDDPAERGEIARCISEGLDLPSVPAKEADHFKDIDDASREERRAIAAVEDAKIMTGYTDGSGEFGVDAAINRAELATLLARSAENLGLTVEGITREEDGHERGFDDVEYQEPDLDFIERLEEEEGMTYEFEEEACPQGWEDRNGKAEDGCEYFIARPSRRALHKSAAEEASTEGEE